MCVHIHRHARLRMEERVEKERQRKMYKRVCASEESRLLGFCGYECLK